jgi:hypothetical protein
MAKVKTAVIDGGAKLTGTFTLYHAEELYSEKRPLHALSIDGGGVSCGLAAAYWNGNVAAIATTCLPWASAARGKSLG